MKIENIKVVIWDFDNTLYAKNEALAADFKSALGKVLSSHLKLDTKEIWKQFHALHPLIYPSDTKTLAVMCDIPVVQAAIELEQNFDRLKYLKYDQKLVDLFTALSGFTHFMFTNGIISKVRECVSKLGVPSAFFQEYISSEITGVNKPDPDGFKYILNRTNLPPESHLMVGDRDKVDLLPAKTLGMKTCLVWGNSQIADLSVPTIYDLREVLI
jgi:HAD superfamily hydrolase (TIGR01549 family)